MARIDFNTSQITALLQSPLDLIKRRLFGTNNERLDFLMDSFYKLDPKQQKGAVLALFGLLMVLVMIIFAIYFSRMSALEQELNTGLEALRDLREKAQVYKSEKARMDWLAQNISGKTSNFKAKPFFEKKANELGVTLDSLRSDELEIPPGSLLSERFKEIEVTFRTPKISLPRLLNFLSEIEKAGQTLTVRNLKIRARYGDRLYFDAEARVVGYKVK